MEGNNNDQQRWTCEACGCNTNRSSDRSCTICGTSNSGPSILRRAGAGYAARANWFARSAAAAMSNSGGRAGSNPAGANRGGGNRGMNQDAVGDSLIHDDADENAAAVLWDSVVDGVEMAAAAAAGDPEDDPSGVSAMESLAMEVSGMAAAAAAARGSNRGSGMDLNRQRFLEAARALSSGAASPPQRSAHVAEPDELLRRATENASAYQPVWADPARLSSRAVGNCVEVGDDARQCLAHVPAGVGEGRAVRAQEPIPRSESSAAAFMASFAMQQASNAGDRSRGGTSAARAGGVFGFRVAFDHPTITETGGNMGGCYLVGITTSSFSAFGEHNGLRQSPYFWGIEDSGHKYEGSRYQGAGAPPPAATRNRRAASAAASASSNFAMQLSDARMNSQNALFGSREVVTVVCDTESRSLCFWRDDTCLGCLVHNLPRSGQLYPVAVPFNSGVTVAITGLEGDPLPLLDTFATDWRKAQQEKDDELIQKLTAERALLIQEGSGKPTPRLSQILQCIYNLYPANDDGLLEYTAASRLWYRSGIKLASLDSFIQEKGSSCISFDDFRGLVERILEEDEQNRNSATPSSSPESLCEVGDKVELVEGFEKFGDASGGPLQRGERGTVVELQRGPGGERSVRVLHNGRRWWYQPQTLLSERSGLIESAGVWFLRAVLRAHGYDVQTLEALPGEPVTATSWCVGDIVVPANQGSDDGSDEESSLLWSPMDSCVGRIVVEASANAPSSAPIPQTGSTVSVEFIHGDFAKLCGAKPSKSPSGLKVPALETRRVKTNKLMHSSVFFGSCGTARSSTKCKDDGSEVDYVVPSFGKGGASSEASVSDKVRSEIAAVGRLDRAAIEAVTKECKKNSESLASLFSAGLPDSIISAIDVAERQMNSLEVREDLSEKICAIGGLATFIADQLFSPAPGKQGRDEDVTAATETEPPRRPPSRPSRASRRVSGADRRQLAREVLTRREARREEDRGTDAQGIVSSLQQRRSVLLSLMSRARRGNANYLNDMTHDLSALGQIPPPLGPVAVRGVQPFVFGPPPGDLMQQSGSWEDSGSFAGVQERPRESASRETSDDDGMSRAGTSDHRCSFLDTLLRCRGDPNSLGSDGLKGTGSMPASFVRHLIENCVLVDSLPWTKALIDAQTKRNQLSSLQRSSPVLRNVVDEEGTSLLQLAVSFGCSVAVLGYLVASGAPVSEAEIEKAAMTDQPRALSLLLRNTSFQEGMVDMGQCSVAVQGVLAEAKVRQEGLDKKMREAAGAFMVRLLRRLLRLALSSRRHQSSRVDLCSRAISEILVGNVLLSALQKTQKMAASNSAASFADDDDGDGSERDSADRTGRFSVDLTHSELCLTPQGLLGSLPQVVLGEALLSDSTYSTTLLMLIEDYLCSKEMGDAAAGLAFLSTLLTKFPRLRSCSEMERYGMVELVNLHDRAAAALTESISRNLHEPETSSGGTCTPSEPLRGVASRPARDNASGVILCPKGHYSVLHITRHSSFRCDLCGCGVERGRPMHGCRQCDWDACECCTDKAEGGLVKCAAIREIAGKCQKLLSDPACLDDDDDVYSRQFVDEVSSRGITPGLATLSSRLWKRDINAVKELNTMLDSPGTLTVHQFLAGVLPALHAALVGSSPGSDEVVHHLGPGRRNKKARPNRDVESGVRSPEDRMTFCKEVARVLIVEPLGGKVEQSSSEAGISPIETDSQTHEHPRDPEENEGDTDESSHQEDVNKQRVENKDVLYAVGGSELVRRLHQILSFYESVTSVPSEKKDGSSTGGPRGCDLQSLTKPIEIQLSPSSFSETEALSTRLVVYAEPLLPISELQLHVLRACQIKDPSYVAFSERLAQERAIIIERPMKRSSGSWQLGQVVGYDAVTGAHTIYYASRWKRGQDRRQLRISQDTSSGDLSAIRYDGSEAKLVLAVREYCVLNRRSGQRREGKRAGRDLSDFSMDNTDQSCSLLEAVGTRVESNCGPDGSWKTFTLVAVDGTPASSRHGDENCFVLVCDGGVVYDGIRSNQIRIQGRSLLDDELAQNPEQRPGRRTREDGGVLNRAFPFLASRQRSDFSTRSDSEGSAPDLPTNGALKRTWSALSLVESMRPLELSLPDDSKAVYDSVTSNGISWKCRLGDTDLDLVADPDAVEVPPRVAVKFSTHEKIPGVDLSAFGETTIVGALKQLYQRHDTWQENFPLKGSYKLFFSISPGTEISSLLTPRDLASIRAPLQKNQGRVSKGSPSAETLADESSFEYEGCTWSEQNRSRSRKSSARTDSTDDNDEGEGDLCVGLDERCVQCMEVLSLLSECTQDGSMQKDKDQMNSMGFANPSLSKKLSEQLENPVYVVGGALPDWCILAPSFAPRVFSYESRRMLLERVAFGVSRSTLKQQEAKVNVGRLRQRMAALRGRAVELVGEAFSGGAEDPTALQLQADELYGMEEALAARVRAAFRAVKWQEHSLQVAKAAVRRDKLLSDATAVMERYATDRSVCRRRLEVRFDGESGFDAASGDEAGVTRGFYADVAEALLASDNVAGVYCSTSCSYVPPTASLGKIQRMDIDELQKEASKLPLWIPDMDTSAQVVIPTPRADERSCLGVYPRPLPRYHPQMKDVVLRFRFIGRLFAAAMRDGFMFSLPLSSAFLRLVQYGTDVTAVREAGRDVATACDTLLTSGDLPRPGFLGGEVYAAEVHICKVLDNLDASEPPLPTYELQRRYAEIASDKNFARVALGKSFDCSFEDFFQDRTFVDPLDPTQGEDAVPLCPGGHQKCVTIYNIREWVALAKSFILHEGVIAQALSFRRGVEDFFSAGYLRLFTSEELQRDVCGVGDNVDGWDESAIRKLFKLDGGKGAAEALVAVAAIGGEGGAALSRRFGPSSPTIAFLVKALLEASPKQRRQFLSFVTSVPIVTPGRIEVVPMVSPSGEFLPMRDPGCLPRANTCARRLYLPKFETFESFSQVIWAVVREESKFKGFYEWRGS